MAQIIDLLVFVALERIPETRMEVALRAFSVFGRLGPSLTCKEVLGIGGEENVRVQRELAIAWFRIVRPLRRYVDLRRRRVLSACVESADDQGVTASGIKHAWVPAAVVHVLLFFEALGFKVEGVD